MGKKVIFAAMRAALALTFLHAGVAKIWNFSKGQSATPDFVLAIQSYEILHVPDLNLALAIYLPWLEVLTACALFIPRLQLGALTALLGMTTVFFAALLSAWQRGLDISCGCFGRDEITLDFRGPLLRDLCILAAVIALLVREKRNPVILSEAKNL